MTERNIGGLYAGLAQYFDGIVKSGKHARVEYIGASGSEGSISPASFRGEVIDVFEDCVVLRAVEREACIPYHAICKVESYEKRKKRERRPMVG